MVYISHNLFNQVQPKATAEYLKSIYNLGILADQASVLWNNDQIGLCTRLVECLKTVRLFQARVSPEIDVRSNRVEHDCRSWTLFS